MNQIRTSALALCSGLLLVSTSLGAPADDNQKTDRARQFGAGARAAGQGRPAMQNAQADRDPAQMVATMMRQFDKDGDQKLNTSELAALLTSMRDRMGAAGGRPGAQQQGNGQRLGGLGDRRAAGAGNAEGGVRPKRPAAGDAK